jgi:hypothetical protein
LQDDLALIDALYGFKNLRYGDSAERVKEEAIDQVRRDFRRGIDFEIYDDAVEASLQRVNDQSIEDDLKTIDSLYGRSKLGYFATRERIKNEALAQTSLYWELLSDGYLTPRSSAFRRNRFFKNVTARFFLRALDVDKARTNFNDVQHHDNERSY